MRLLIITQAVDRSHPVLGFFHNWLRALAAHAEFVEVVSLSLGKYELPENVRVHSLGKEKGRQGKIRYALRFLWHAWSLRRSYDAVLVHMNQEYVLMAGLLWKLLGKRVYLWRNHAEGSLTTRIVGALSDGVFYTSPQAYVASFRNAARMPVGIETGMFCEPRTAAPDSLLFLGRIDPVKRLGVLLEAVSHVADPGTHVSLSVYGGPTDSGSPYFRNLREKYAELEEDGIVSYHGAVSHAETPHIYAGHRIFVNLTQAGSFDKTLFEAMAAGCLVISNNPGLKGVLPEPLFIEDESRLAEHIARAVALTKDEEVRITADLRTIAEEHSLDTLCAMLIRFMDHGQPT